MPSTHNKQREDDLTLELLAAIEEDSALTQRRLARRLGVALGLANSYLRRCVRKGLVKIQQVPPNRYLYFLTPSGFSEKSRLTGRYLSLSFRFYRRAGESCARAFRTCEARGYRRLLVAGATDLAEIAAVRALEHDVRVVGILDERSEREHLVEVAVFRRVADCPPADAWLLAQHEDPVRAQAQLRERGSGLPVVVPDILGVRASEGDAATNHEPADEHR